MSKKSGHWISGAIEHPGYLHRATGTPAGKDIPQSTLAKDAHSSNPHLAHAARLAETLEHMPHGHHPGHEGSTHHKAGSSTAKHVADVLNK